MTLFNEVKEVLHKNKTHFLCYQSYCYKLTFCGPRIKDFTVIRRCAYNKKLDTHQTPNVNLNYPRYTATEKRDYVDDAIKFSISEILY